MMGTKANADAPAQEKKEAPAAAPTKTFTGGDQGFVDLKLKEVQEYSPNTKKFIFELPEADAVSGLSVACTSALSAPHESR
jgi:cytochrome-b5 reductase